MKSVYKIFAVILAAGLTAMSCDKKPINEDIPVVNPEGGDNGSEQDAGTRIITLSFDTKATRTDLGPDYKPKFSNGDMIAISSISSPTDTQHCKVTVNSTTGIATTVTKFDGECKAVYPAKYAKIIDGELTFIVPSEQTGKFEDANICTADIPEGKNPVAEFENQTAVFEIDIDPEWQARRIEVWSLRWINEDTGQRYTQDEEDLEDFYCYSIICNAMSDGSEGYELIGDDNYEMSRMISIGYNNPNADIISGKCYVSVFVDEGYEVCLCDLNFDVQNHLYQQDTDITWYPGGGYMGGFSPYFLSNLTTPLSLSTTVAKNSFYSNVEDHLHGYVNAGYLCYSTEDLGIAGDDTSETGYYAWGEITGHSWNGEKFEPISNDSGYAFSWDNSPFGKDTDDVATIKATCKKTYGGSGKNADTLPLEYDAAYYNWGGAWRMPRYSDEASLNGDTFKYSTDANYTHTATSTKRGTLVFTKAGYGDGTSLKTTTASNVSTYWTSSWYSGKTEKAYVVTVNTSSVGISSPSTQAFASRYMGNAIRPVVGPEHDKILD